MPNVYADRIEWMCDHLISREALIISVHPHNDRGTAAASAEMALLAGADRVEGTLFGNGERAGNVDLMTLAFNLYSQGIDPRLRLDTIDEVKRFCEEITGVKTHIRHPYVGEMIYTAFSGGHQDAIKKGFDRYRKSDQKSWVVPYLLIDPKDIHREYDQVVRINSQSGKGGVDFIVSTFLGESTTKEEARRFGKVVKRVSDEKGKELSKEEVISLCKEREMNRWDAKTYQKEASFVYELAMPVVEMLAPKKGEKILDIGCGEGTLSTKIQEKGAKVKALDLSADMVEKARLKGIDATVMSATSMVFEEAFDAVFSNAVLHWIKDADSVVKNIYKALKKGGRFVAEFGGEGNAQTVVSAMEEAFERHPKFGKFVSPWYFPSVDVYRSFLEKNGFRVGSIEMIPRPTPVSSVESWLTMFANGVVEHLSQEGREIFKEETARILRSKLYSKEKGWVIDYKRLRVKAIKGD